MKIQRKKLSHEIIDQLRDRIYNGEWSDGDHLPSERELMEYYGVGRPAVREALQTLERDGMLEISHGERARVITPTAHALIDQITSGARHLLRSQPGTLDHVKQARLFLESGMAQLAAERATSADLEQLASRLEDQRAALGNQPLFIECDMAFHREIARISGNPIYPAIVEALFKWASEHYITSVLASGAENVTLMEHQQILDAIGSGNAEVAAKSVRDHLNRASVLYRISDPVGKDLAN